MVKINDYTAKKVAKILGSQLDFDDFIIDKITLNSKEITEKNGCFFAIKGESLDGHNYVNEAIKNGADLIIAERKIDANIPVIYVENTVKALGKLASYHKGKTKIIGVTGSVGKTTTKDMIFSVLKEKYKVIATEGNYNNEIGVPLTLLRLKDEDFCVLEMGMRGLGEIDYLTSISHPETAVITNALTSHIERLKTEENIFLAKKEILNYVPKYAVLPSENRFKMLDLQGIKAFFVGDCENTFISDYKYTNDGITFSISNNNKIVKNIKIKSFSRHNLINALFAYQVGEIYNLSDNEFAQGIANYKSAKMHEEIININGITIISDCYNASFESVKSAIYTLKEYCKINNKKMNALLGDILEVGELSEKIHYKIGQICKDNGVCRLLTYGDYAKNIISGFGNGQEFKQKSEISNFILKELNENDVLLVKASRNLHFEEIINEMKEKK